MSTATAKMKVARIIAKRDECPLQEAWELVLDTCGQIEESGMDYDEVEEIVAENLGLEMDYVMDLI